jgi:hypothetical protein
MDKGEIGDRTNVQIGWEINQEEKRKGEIQKRKEHGKRTREDYNSQDLQCKFVCTDTLVI